MIKISICICTRNRQEGLKKILDSLENMQTPDHTIIKIVIIENDVENYSENIVKRFSAKSKFNICYYLENMKGLAFARNRSVKEAGDCDFCCFVDDDQIVDLNWLSELLKCQSEYNADGVWGLCPPIFSKKVPVHIKDYYEPRSYQYGELVEDAGTGSLLIKKSILDKIEGPFDLRLNFTGGEDYHLTTSIIRNGGTIRFNPNAIAHEFVPSSRTTIFYLVKRTYRKANAGYFIKSFSEPEFRKIQALPRLLLRFFYGLVILLPYLILAKKNKLKGLLKLVSAVGGVNALYWKINRFYA